MLLVIVVLELQFVHGYLFRGLSTLHNKRLGDIVRTGDDNGAHSTSCVQVSRGGDDLRTVEAARIRVECHNRRACSKLWVRVEMRGTVGRCVRVW